MGSAVKSDFLSHTHMYVIVLKGLVYYSVRNCKKCNGLRAFDLYFNCLCSHYLPGVGFWTSFTACWQSVKKFSRNFGLTSFGRFRLRTILGLYKDCSITNAKGRVVVCGFVYYL